MNLRRLAVLGAALAVIEGVGIAADARWAFRGRLLNAFDLATHQPSADDPLWAHPERPFEPGGRHTQVLQFRLATSDRPTGERLDPASLPQGRRAFVLGESAAFGVNCPAAETFAARLDDALRPRSVHVFNAGQIGADAWQVMDAGAQLLERYTPSALVIFTGNNPWISWSPPQQARANPTTIGILRTLATSRALAGLELLLFRWVLTHPSPTPGFHDHGELTGSGYALAHPLEASPAFGPDDWAAVKRLYLQRFETSLTELVTHAQARHVRPLLVTMPFNYRLSPAWKHPQFEAYTPEHRAQVRALLHDAGRRVQAGDCQGALPRVEQALALDPSPPLLHYLRAQCLERLGRLDEAEASYAQSREQMIGNLGSRLSINTVIRRVATQAGVPLVDAARIFDAYEHAHGHHFNEDLLVDDCHPSPLGHQLIADALAPLL